MTEYELEIVETASNRVLYKVTYNAEFHSVADVLSAFSVPSGYFARLNGQRLVA
jgi:hypothetical protein